MVAATWPCIAIRGARGLEVIVCTTLPHSGQTGYNARRATCNSAINSSWTGVHSDGVPDFASDAQMGGDTVFTSFPANWGDSIHPNATGHARPEAIFRLSSTQSHNADCPFGI